MNSDLCFWAEWPDNQSYVICNLISNIYLCLMANSVYSKSTVIISSFYLGGLRGGLENRIIMMIIYIINRMEQIWFSGRLFKHTREMKQNKGRTEGLEEETARELSCVTHDQSGISTVVGLDIFRSQTHYYFHYTISGLLYCWSDHLTFTCLVKSGFWGF